MHIIRHTHIKFTRIWWRYVTRVREAHRICISIEKNDLQYKLERNFLALKKAEFFRCFPHYGRNKTHTRVNNRNFVLHTHILLLTPHYFLSVCILVYIQFYFQIWDHTKQPICCFSISAMFISMVFPFSQTYFKIAIKWIMKCIRMLSKWNI